MKVLFINNHGSGFADYIEVAVNTRVSELFQQQIQGGKPSDFLIRVNRQPVASDYVLQPNDRVSITATKIEGANRQRAASAWL